MAVASSASSVLWLALAVPAALIQLWLAARYAVSGEC